MFRVVDIDWSNKDINRVGIVPIVIETKRKWIGLEISNITSSITTIGGYYESIDHDLLDTVVREYNEEVGYNMESITIETILCCYAFCSKTSITIFLPIKQRPDKIIPTEELYDIIWITSEQLRIMAVYQDFRIINGAKRGESKPKAFVFSNDLIITANDIANFVENQDTFSYLPPVYINRPKKIKGLKELIIVQDIIQFEQDFLTKYKKHAFGVILSNYCAIYIDIDNIMYLIPIYVAKNVLSRWKGRLLMSDNDSIKDLFGKKYYRSYTIHHYIQQMNNDDLLIKFEYNLSITRLKFGISRIIMELNLLIDIERIAYKQIRKNGNFFYQKRADLLRGINKINIILSNPLLSHDQISIIKQLDFSSEISHKYIINIMLITNLIFSKSSLDNWNQGNKFNNILYL